MLSDAELDNIYVGGFDFNINAAYAFRSAVISQFNVAAVACVNSNGSNNITINSSNSAVLMNRGDSAVTNQNNISTVVAKSGDIINSVINNFNTAHVTNVFTNENANTINSTSVETPVDTPAPGLATPANDLSLNTAVNKPETGEGVKAGSLPVETPVAAVKTNGVSASASAVVTQTNIAAFVAIEGNIGNTKINNANLANIENQGNSALAVQTNIALVIAKGTIENTEVKNSNIANVLNDNTVDNGHATVTSASWQGTLANFQVADIMVNNQAKVTQVDITFMTSLGDKIRNSIIREILSSQVRDIR